MKNCIVLLVPLIAGLALAWPQAQGTTQVEEATYTVVRNFSNLFEERLYPSSKWVCTKNTILDGTQTMFFRLFRYISKQNSASVEIPMTAPVSTSIGTNAATTKKGSREMCFLISKEFQSDTPTPTNPLVYINERPAMSVYTRRVSEAMEDDQWVLEAEALRSLIEEQNLQIDGTHYFTNGYNSPEEVTDFRNEVWWIKN